MTGSHSNPRDGSHAAVTTPPGMAAACARCGATVAAGSSACPRCGAVVTGSSPAEQAERIRLRLQESIGDAYRLIELLGRGGMGIVFRAHELALDREVALKVLALDPILSPDAYARFEREARLAARLDHPHVVPIFAVGQRNTVAFYTMRLVRGGTLEDMLTGHKALDFQHALEILRDVARALDYAHGQGVVHRDIKPANVLIGDSGHAMVSDFGIAKGLGVGDGPLATGAVIGSPGYMSPEQWRGEEIDSRADQYALGVMAFEMLTGHRPFETVKVQDLMRLHLSAEVPGASSIKPTLPPFVDLSIRRAMSKSPSDRFTSASTFIDALAGKRPVSGMTRTSMQVVARPASANTGFVAGLKAVAALLILGVLAAGTTFAIQRRTVQMPHGMPLLRTIRKPAAAPAPTVTTPPAPSPADSTLNVDTTFDLNATANNSEAAERRPVAVDPTLFAGRNGATTTGAPGYIRVVARGGAAKVRVDGRTYGFSPLTIRVDPGLHVVSLESSGDAFLPSQISVTAVSNDTIPAVFTARVARTGSGDSENQQRPTPKPAAAAPAPATPIPAASAKPAPTGQAAPAAPNTSPPASPPASSAPADQPGDATSLPASTPPSSQTTSPTAQQQPAAAPPSPAPTPPTTP